MTEVTPSALVEQGIRYYQAKDFASALTQFDAALRYRPDDAELWSLKGLVLAALGRLDEAFLLLQKAVAQEPEQVGYQLNLARALIESGRFADGIATYQTILQGDSSLLPALAGLARAYLAQGQPEKAADLLLGKFHDGVAGPAIFHLLCQALSALARWSELVTVSNRWTRQHPSVVAAWNHLASAYYQLGEFEKARQAQLNALKLTPLDVTQLTQYGHACLNLLDYQEAEVHFNRAEQIDPHYPPLLSAKGLLLTYQGKFEQAIKYCERSIALAPHYLAAYTPLSRLRKGRFTPAEYATLITAQSQSTSLEDKMRASYLLGHHCHAVMDYTQAIRHYQTANALNARLNEAHHRNYDTAISEAYFKGLRKRLWAPPCAPQKTGHPQPIFIVGLPRSGTSLLEAMMSAHPQITGLGERIEMPRLLAHIHHIKDRDLTQHDLMTLREQYLSGTGDIKGGAYFIDKNPANLEAVGLIHQLFPDAPILYIRRAPLETCLSIFRHEFSPHWSFATHLTNIGHYCLEAARLAQHWQRELGHIFLTIQYEEFADAPVPTLKAILGHCGIHWHDNCQQFQHYAPSTATLSAVQIREKVSVSRYAKDYQSILQGLSDYLQQAGTDLATGALR